MIYLYESTETEFKTAGYGGLPDATYCSVFEERNGSFELEMEYPITGYNYANLKKRRIIMAKPNPYSQEQPFRIYKITRPINGLVTVYAEHISYDLSGVILKPFTAASLGIALNKFKSEATPEHKFSFTTDKSMNADFIVDIPTPVRTMMGGEEGSILDIYGPLEYEFDRFTIKALQERGRDRGVGIIYGKNMTDLNFEEDDSGVFTHVFPYWSGIQYPEEGDSESDPVEKMVTLSNMTIKCPGSYNYTKIMVLDCSSIFEEPPTEAELKEFTNAYITENKPYEPSVSVTASFVDTSAENPAISNLLEVRLCDTVTVAYPELGVDVKTKCISTDYDVISGRYNSLELGSTSGNLASTVVNQNKNIDDVAAQVKDKTQLQIAIDHATDLITGGLGGYVIIHSSSGDDKHPDEILILDTPDIKTAKNVWRWNKGGLGFSSTGYDGEYRTAITMDGKIVADFITAGQLDGAVIKGGTILGDSLSIEYRNEVDNRFSTIETTTEGIKLSVEKKVDNDKIINAINVSTEGVKIKASKFDVDASAIRLQSTKLSWSSTYSSMTENGTLKCSNAELKGTMKAGTDDGFWVELASTGKLRGGKGSSQYGYVDYSASMYLQENPNTTWKGLQIQGGCLRISTTVIAVASTTNVDTVTSLCGSGTLKYVEKVTFGSDGSTTVTNGSIKFINGLMVTDINGRF